MKCANPTLIQNPQYDPDKDPRKKIFVRCGQCYWCLAQRRAEWFARLSQEAERCPLTLFVTLTQNDVAQTAPVDKVRLQNYFRYLRKDNDLFSFKYYAIGEYGSKFGRPHYHVVFFIDSMVCTPLEVMEAIRTTWKHGFIEIGPVTPARLNYVLHYHVRPKKNTVESMEKERTTFALCSQGLGMNDDPAFVAWIQSSSTTIFHTMSGDIAIIPRYYRKKFCIDISEREYEEKYLFDFAEYAEKYGYDAAHSLRHDYEMLSDRKMKQYNAQETF